MVHDPSSRAAARNLLAESDVVPSDELSDALAELRNVGQRPVPPISPALAEAMRGAVSSAGQPSDPRSGTGDNVVPLRSGKVRRRGAAVGGAVVLAMAAGMGGVAAFGPDNAVETAIQSVIRWAAPTERTEPVSDEQPAPAQPESVPEPEAPPAAELPAPAPSQAAPEPVIPSGTPSPDASRTESTAPATGKGESEAPGGIERRVLPPVEIPDLPVTIPDPAPTPRSLVPVSPPQLPLPTEAPTPAPSERPSR